MSDAPRLSLADLAARIARNPFNVWLGAQIESASVTGVCVRVPWRDELYGNASVKAIHGGVLGCLIDTCGSYSVIAQTGETALTVDYRVDLHRSTGGKALLARGEIVKHGRTLSVVDVRVVDADEQLVASGRVVVLNVARKP